MKGKIKLEKGITLIALIITIIILLILAGVTLGTLSRTGIFSKATNSKDRYVNAQEKEKTEIAKATNEIDSYVDEKAEELSNNKENVNRYIIIGNYSSNAKRTIDIKEFTDKYQEISLDNFLIKNTKQKYQNQSLAEKYNNVLSAYDATNGILTLEQSSTNGEGYGFYFDYTVYLFVDKKPNIIQLGSYTSNTIQTIDLKEYTSKYGQLDLNNFYLKSVIQRWKNGSLSQEYNNIIGSYNKTTGILRLEQSSTNSSANGFGFYVDYEICVVLDELVQFE